MIDRIGEGQVVYVYELRDPRDITCSPRYVGITKKKLNVRLREHILIGRAEKPTYKKHWIHSLLMENVEPTIHLIETVTGWGYACEVEKYYIKEFREQGYRLTNSTVGGDGIPGYIFDEETIEKAKISRAKTLKSKELSSLSGISLVKNTGKWESYIWVNNVKLCLGTYVFKEDAEKIREIIIKEKHKSTSPDIEDLRKIVKEYYKKEWCRKLLLKPPCITYIKKVNRWKATTFHIGGKHKFLGEYSTKELAIEAYNKKVPEYVEDILKDYIY